MQQRRGTRFLKAVTAALAWTGLAVAVAIGAYIIYVFLHILSLGYTGEILYLHIIAAALGVVSAGTLLLYGGHHALKGSLRKAGIENTVASLILLTLFLYFYGYTQFIAELGAIAWLLFAPALASGVTALSMAKLGKRAERLQPPTPERVVVREKVVVKAEWKVKCRHCGSLVEVTTDKCPNCGEKPF